MNILLVEPNFPIPHKSKNHKNFLPIGLLKLASYYRSNGNSVQLVRGNVDEKELKFKPQQIMITALFTYWSKYVKDSVEHYRKICPHAKVIVGGIYASLMPDHCKKYTGCDEVYIGVHKHAENYPPAYDLVNNPHPLNYQIVHISRGCFRKCSFCGAWKIEPEVTFKKSIKDEICSNKLIFYDNNLLANPHIKGILKEISQMTYNRRVIHCEAQCGFDGRLLTPEIALLIKKARFKNPRIAWDGPYSEHKNIKKQIDMLSEVGYRSKEIYVFMLYNWKIPFNEMEKKRIKCWEWQVQIADCRYRPLNQTYDSYNSVKRQTNKDFFIHPSWTDEEVKKFRRNVRRQNICVRHGFSFYSKDLEYKRIDKKILSDVWFPNEITTVCSIFP